MQCTRLAWFAALLVALFFLGGCGNNVQDVSGTIQVDGKPAEEGTIVFVPADGKTQTASGLIKGGSYSAKVPLGQMKVAISVPKVVGKKKSYDTPDSPERPITEESLPAKYSNRDKTELQFEVKSGQNKKDWELKTQ